MENLENAFETVTISKISLHAVLCAIINQYVDDVLYPDGVEMNKKERLMVHSFVKQGIEPLLRHAQEADEKHGFIKNQNPKNENPKNQKTTRKNIDYGFQKIPLMAMCASFIKSYIEDVEDRKVEQPQAIIAYVETLIDDVARFAIKHHR